MKRNALASLALASGLALAAQAAMAGPGCCGGAPSERNPAPAKAAEQEAELKPQTLCPVMGGKIDKSLYVDQGSRRIYVCCRGCIDAVKSNPESQVRKLAGMGQAPGQALCPIMNRPIDPKLYADHGGSRIYVCCRGCVARVKADPEAALKKLKDQGVAPERIKPETKGI